jgi:Tfp pilus assembly protein PilW
MNNLLKSPKGFTLMELILYVFVSSIILLAITFGLFLALESRTRQQTVAEVNQQGLQVMQLITQTIRNAKSVTTPSFGTSSSTLSLQTSDGTRNPTVFYASSTSLYMTEGTTSPVRLTNSHVKISNIVFQNISSAGATQGVVEISFTLSFASSTNRNEYSYTKDFVGSASFVP